MHFTLLPEKKGKTAHKPAATSFEPFYKGSNKTAAFLSDHLLYFLAFLIPCAALLAIMQYFSFAPFGDKNMFVSQGAFYNMTVVTDAIHSLHNGTFHWFTLSGSEGMEYYSTFAYYLCSPFTLICLLFQQETAVSLLSVFTVLRICASAPLFIYYLTHRESGAKASIYNPSVLIFGLGYALSSYALVQYNDFMFLDIFMLFPLLMVGLERLMYRKKCLMFYILLSICLFSNFYLGLILIPFLLVYTVLKSDGALPDRIKTALRFMGFCLAAVCTSAATVIPGMAGMYRSMISTTYLIQAGNLRDYFTFIYQHLFYSYPSYLYQADWGYNLYIGIAPLMLFILYFFAGKQSIRKRLCNFLVIFFAVLSLQLSPLAYAMHLGNSSQTYYSAYAFIYLFLILSPAYDALQELQDMSLAACIIGLLSPIVLCLVSIVISTTAPNYSSVQFSLSLMLVYMIVFVLFCKKSIQRESLFYILLLFSCLELLANAFQNYSYINQAAKPVINCLVQESQDTSADSALPMHTDILYGSRQYRTLTYGLHSRYSINPFISCSSTDRFSPLEDALHGVKTLYVNKDSASDLPNDMQYQKTGSDEIYDIYTNQYAFPTAYFIEGLSSDTPEITHSTFFSRQNSIAEAIGGSALFEPADMTCEITPTDKTIVYDLAPNLFSIYTGEDLEALQSSYSSLDITFTPDKSGDLYLWIADLIHFGQVEAGKEYTYKLFLPAATIYENVYWIQSAYFDTESMSALAQQVSTQAVPFHYTSPSCLALEASFDSTGSIMTYLPDSEYYHIFIDGEAASGCSLDGLFYIPVPAGTHSIMVSYEYTPFYIGLWCSLAALGVLLLLCLICSKIRLRSALPSPEAFDRSVLAFSTFCRENYVYLLAFFIPFLSVLGYLIYNTFEPFGSYFSIFSGDSLHAAFPSYAENLRLLSGEGGYSAHSWNGGGGFNVSSIFSTLHMPSTTLFSVPYSKITQYTAITWLLSLSLCGPSLVYYLTHRLMGRQAYKKDYRLLLAALSYCMCNYFLMMLNNYSWYTAFLLLPLIILQMDYLMVNGKKRGYIITLLLAIYLNYYISMFICIYLVIRFFTYHFDSLADFIRKGLRFALCSISVALPAFNTLYFALQSLSGSTYSADDADIGASTASLWFNDFSYIFNRQAIWANAESISWNEGDVNLYFGILTLLLVCIYVCARGIKWQEKLRQLLPYGIFFMALNQPALNYIINGFHYQHGVPNRFAFLLAFMAATISYDLIIHIRRQTWRQVIPPFILLSGIFWLSYRMSENDEKNLSALIVSLIFLGIYLILLLFILYGRKRYKAATVALLCIFILELNINAYPQITANYGSSLILHNIEDAVELLRSEYAIDETLLRVTNPNPLCTNYPLAYGIKGNALFSGGTITKYQLNTARYNGLYPLSNAVQTNGSQTFIGNALACNQYILITQTYETATLTDLFFYEPIACTPNTIILRNNNIFPFAYYLPSSALSYSDDVVDFDNSMTKPIAAFWNHLSDTMLSGDQKLAETIRIYNKKHFDTLTENYLMEITEDRKTLLRCNATMPCDGDLYSAPSAFEYVGNYKKGETVSFDIDITEYLDAERFGTDVFVLHRDVFFDLVKEINKNPFTVTSFSDDTVEGSITMPQAGIVNFSMPFDPCWQAAVDGEPVQTQAFADAYLCMEVPEGEHTIQLTYVDDRWKLSKTVTILSWILLSLCIVIKDLRDRKKRKSTQTHTEKE